MNDPHPPFVSRSGGLPVHIFTVRRPEAVNGKRVHQGGTTFEVLIPGHYCSRDAARSLLEHRLAPGYRIVSTPAWRGDISCVDHQRLDLDNYGATNVRAA